MKLTITIDVKMAYDRRKMNNILADMNGTIQDFISRASASELERIEKSGNQNLNLKIQIEE